MTHRSRGNVKGQACARCHCTFPVELVQPLRLSGRGAGLRGTVVDVCGQCALDLMNAFHGSHLKNFAGEYAEWCRLDGNEHIRKTGQTRRIEETDAT